MGIFDDIPSSGGRQGIFDDIPDQKPDGGFVAAAKQGIGQAIKGLGQVATDYIPGVTAQNPISQYGQSVVDANQTAVNSFGGIVDKPWTAVKEAVGNAAGSMGTMLGARALGMGITAAAPFTGLAAPVVAGAGQLIANAGPIVAAALPSYSGIRETQIAADQGNEADAKSKAIAALGAATVGAIETKFGPQDWALAAMKKGGFSAIKDKLGAETLLGAVGKGLGKGAAIEGAEELVQNPIEQLAGYQNPTTPEALQETAFGGAMGAIGGGVVGGGVSGIAHFAEKPKGPLQKAAEASPSTIPPDAAPLPVIPDGANQETPQPAAGIASAAQNTPAAPGTSPIPVSTAEPPPSSNQAESAGVPISQPQEGIIQRGNETEIPQPTEPGQQAQPAEVSGAAGAVGNTGAQPANAARDAADAEREWQDFVTAEGRDIGPRQLAVIRGQFFARRPATEQEAEIYRGEEGSALYKATKDAKGRLAVSRVSVSDPHWDEKINLIAISSGYRRLGISASTDHMRSPGLASTGWSADEALDAAEKRQPDPPKTVSDAELDAFIKEESADLGKRRETLRGLQAARQQKQIDDADKADLDALIELERADLRERMIQLRRAQAAAREKKPFVIPALTTPAQPTTHGSPLEQTATQMPIGEYGRRKPADTSELDDFIASESADIGKRRSMILSLQAIRQQKQIEAADKAELDALIESERADLRERIARLRAARAVAPTPPKVGAQSVDAIAAAIHSSIGNEATKRARRASTADRAAEIEAFWKNESPGEHTKRLAQAIVDRNPLPLLHVLVSAYSTNQGTARAFEKITGVILRGNAEARTKAIFDWAGWSEQQVAAHVSEKRKAMQQAAEKRADDIAQKNADNMRGRFYLMPDGSKVSAADIIDERIGNGFTELREGKAGAAKSWTQFNPETRSGYKLRDKSEADYFTYRMSKAGQTEDPMPSQPAPTVAAEPLKNSEELPAKSAKLNYDEESTPKEAPDDSADQGGSPSLDQPMAEGQRPDNPIRGAVHQRSRPRRPDDRGVRGAGRRADGSTDESKPLGDGGRSAAVSDGTDGVVAGGVRRVSADFRPGLGALTREGSWFDAAKRNIDLIELAIQIDKEKRNATTEEQAQLAKYVGFGASEIRNALFPIPSDYAKRLEPNRLVWPDLVRDARWKPIAERIDALPREWQKSILQSTQYAHYTSEGIIRSIWSAIQRLGFTGGNIFEPGTGIGSFSMLMPDGIHETSRFTGVEFDAPTALIARLLSPDQLMQHDDFIKRKFPKNYFDVNVGNPPFSQTKVLGDAEYAKHGFMLHDFFFAKGLDIVRPGGLQVFVTSKGTMDKKTDRARKFLSDRADLIGAIRLPSTAFEDNAGTSVVTDVIFLRKRAPGEAPGGMAWNNLKEVETKDGPVLVNEYFADHPEMVLGQQRISGNVDDIGRRVNSNGYGGEKYTVVSYDSTPAELDAKFAEAVERLPENVYSPLRQSDEAVKEETRKVDFDPSVKREGVIYLDKDGAILRVSSGVGVPLDESVKLSDKDRAWLKGYVGIRDLVQSARLAQVTDGDWKAELRALNKSYDAFRAKHGPILDFRTQVRKSTDEDGNIVETESRIFKNKRLYREDYDSALLTSLESISESGEIVKSPFLLGRTIGKPVVVEVNGIGDALAVSLDSIGSLDLADVGRRMGLSMEDTIEALGNQIYRTPAGQWQLADEYLSGDVVTKLEEAEHLARSNPDYRRNVEALKEVQPEKLGPSQISVKLGAAWVPVEHVNEFAKEIGAGHVTFDIKTETWQVEGGNRRTERKAGAEYGTTARSASELLEASLNSLSIKVTAVVDKKTVTDVKATTAANEMAKKIKDKFKRWVWTGSDRASELVEAYNKRFNNIAPRKFDGSHLTLPGVSLRFKLHPHQLRSIWRQIQTGDTYLAHAVGAGKTIEMIAGAMEQKRLGLIKKPMFVVPNHMLEQFSNEFMELYPLANIMVADDENFSAERRKAFVASATLNSPDAIIITHSAFKRIGVTEASVAPIRNEIVTDLEMELASLAKDQGTRVRRSQLEQQIEAVNQRFDAIIGASGKDSTIKFEDIGADFIYADEAHAFRKLDFHTAQQIKGIDPNGSQAAMDMYIKTRILERARPGRSFVFASGTPVTNTMGELFTIMRFFAPQEMELSGISTFDSWSRQFGEVAPALEPNAAGKYELVERFAKFDNVPELMSRVRQFMDVLTSESLGSLVKRPNLAGGKPNLVVVEPTSALKAYMAGELSRRIEASKAWKPSPGQMSNPDPIVSIITDGRFAAIDPRFFGAELEGESIITKMASNVIAKYHETKDNVYYDKEGAPAPIKGSTQIVFYNLGFGEQSQKSRGFNARAAFTKLLTDGGIRRDEIAWFDDANTDAKKEAIFKDMRSGKLKVLIGSAKKMGTGVNVQNRLIALHYQDPPWFPADVEQPHGRIIRQGNLNPEVSIDWYTTKGTYQSTMWQMVGRKQRFIDQAFTGDKSLRSMDDMGEASLFEQAAAVASGDPRALQLAGLRQDVERFERLQAAHASEQISIRSALRSAEWNADAATKRIARLSKAFKAIGERYFQFDSGVVDGRPYNKPGEFGQALKDAFNLATRSRLMDMVDGESVPLATIGSAIKITMEAQIDKNNPTGSFSMHVEFGGSQFHVVTEASLGEETDAAGLARKVFNQINNVDNALRTSRADLAKYETEIIRLGKKMGAPFEYQQEMAEKYGELKRLESELQGENAPDSQKSTRKKQEPDSPLQQAAMSGALPDEVQTVRYDYQDALARDSGALPGESRFNQFGSNQSSRLDRAIYDMAQEGKPAAEILSFIGKVSRRPFNRYLANALRNLGADSTITLDSMGGWRFGNTSRAQKYAAAYNSRTDTVALFTPREAERNILHELVHAATMKAIKAGGTSALRMRALFRHVQKSGKLDGQYGMSNLDEFVAEVFTNPKFQEALKGILAPTGSSLKSAWQWFVRIVSRVLGLKTPAMETALDRALKVGAQLMRENAAGMAANEDTRYAIAWHGTPHVWGPEPGFPHGRPRLDKIGSGEGAQVYGWGWYSAEAERVAKDYRERLAAKMSPDEIGGAIYQLDIPDDVMPNLLDWDKPLSEQTSAIQEYVNRLGMYDELSGYKGSDIYRALEKREKVRPGYGPGFVAHNRSAAKRSSEKLAKAGIPGLRYLDGNSRNKGDGTYNYVIWDQKVLDRIALLERNGEKLDAIRAADEMRFSLDGSQPFDGREVASTPLKPGAKTIMVDGVERPALNSDGKPIHWSEEGIRNFWRWFGDSKVVDAQGRPLVVYHGSPDIRFIKEEAIFKSQKDRILLGRSEAAHWFSSDKRTAKSYADPRRAFDYQNSEEGVIESYLRIENPLVFHADGQEWKTAQKRGKTSDVIEEARASSKDGVIINNVRDDYNNSRSTRPTRTFTVFESTQIKSSTGNTGAFSPTDPDIRFNIATDWQKSPVAQEVAKAFSAAARSDEKLSWLNPVQTQYHKAERLAKEGKFGFKRVFDLGQKFLSDISRFAIMAENSAPTLFHQIRSLADAKQAVRSVLGGDFGRQHNADIKAIAAPLYEGTLYGGADPTKGIVWSDDQLRSRFSLTDRQIELYREAREAVKVSMDNMAKALIARHAKREKMMVSTDGSLREFSEEVRDMLNLRAKVLDDEAQAKFDGAMRQADGLRKAGGKDNLAEAKAMEREANDKRQSQKDESARIRATAEDVMAIAEKAEILQDAGYFPLMRFGRHTVTAKDANGEVRHFSMHDGIPLVPRSGQAQANLLADALREEHPEWTVTTGLMNPEKYKLYQGMNVDALQLFADHLDDETRNTYQEIIRLATNERSALRRMLKREGTPGFDRDVRRTLASFILSNARYTSSSYHLADMAKAAEEAEKDGGDVGAEAVKLYDYVTKPQEEAAKLRSFLFFNFLGGSLAAAMVNATQVPMMTFPRLSQYEDAGKLAKRLAMAAKMAVRNPAEVSGVVGDALRNAEEDGVTAPHQIYEMTATASANVFGGSRAGNAIMRAWGLPFALAEAFNRRTTFIAAFQIAQGMTESQLREAGASTAFEFAEKMVNETQGIYNRGNRMNLGRGAIGATVMTFKQFSVMYLEMFSRLPAKQKAIMAGVLILAAGAGGLPFAEDIEDIIDTIGQWLGYRTNVRRTIRRGLSDMAGQQAADAAMNGVLSQMGIDLHSRLGLQNLIPGTAMMKTSTTDKGREFQDLLGPAASVVAAMGQALQELATGHPGRAAMALSPVSVQNVAKGAEMLATGHAEDMRGKPTIPVSTAEAVAKGIGFNPKAVADYGAVKRDILQDERLQDVMRERFTSAIVDAVVAGDQDARREAVQGLADWNERNPGARIVIAPATIRKRVAEMRSEGPARIVKSLSPSLRQQARQEFADAQR